MLAPALWWNVADGSLKNFQQRLLHPFTKNITRDADVLGLAPDLVDFVDVDDAELSLCGVVVRRLQQSQDDVLNIFTDVASFSQCRRIGDAERHVQNLRQRLGEQRLATTSRTEEQDVALLHLDVVEFIEIRHLVVCTVLVGQRKIAEAVHDALVVVVHCD